MSNSEIVALLYEIADYLEIKGDFFKPRAYRKAAQYVESMSGDIGHYAKTNTLTELPTIGVGIAKKIIEFFEKGESSYLKKLKKEMPVDVESLLRVEGLGPKKIHVLYKKLKVTDISSLKKAAQKEKIRSLEGFGEKTEQHILESIDFVQESGQRLLLGDALPLAEDIVEKLKQYAVTIEIAGSLRRRKETIGDIDILATAKNNQLIEQFVSLQNIREVVVKGPTKTSIKLTSGVQVDVRIIKKDSWGAALNYFTGSKQHNIQLRRIAKVRKLKLNEYGLFKGTKKIAGKTEIAIYKKLGLAYTEPELRELHGEIEAAQKKKLPDLIQLKDVKGDLQMHTMYSDGTASLKEMAAKAASLGYEYIAITDHFGNMKIANAMNLKRLEKQIKEIRKIKENITVFTGMEVNIKNDGSLDASEKALKIVDVVVASVHSGFKDTKEKMTQRLVKALENKHITTLGHPTGRLLNKRKPFDFDVEKVFQTAKDNNKLLEINCHPQRLDLKDTHVKKAVDMGCTLSFGTDAHSVAGLDTMKYGVFTARRGWAEKKDVVNTKKLKNLEFT